MTFLFTLYTYPALIILVQLFIQKDPHCKKATRKLLLFLPSYKTWVVEFIEWPPFLILKAMNSIRAITPSTITCTLYYIALVTLPSYSYSVTVVHILLVTNSGL